MRRAGILASLYDRELLIEAQVPGESYRLLVLEGRMVDAVCRRGPRLEGDGVSRIRSLIEAEDARRRAILQPMRAMQRRQAARQAVGERASTLRHAARPRLGGTLEQRRVAHRQRDDLDGARLEPVVRLRLARQEVTRAEEGVRVAVMARRRRMSLKRTRSGSPIQASSNMPRPSP